MEDGLSRCQGIVNRLTTKLLWHRDAISNIWVGIILRMVRIILRIVGFIPRCAQRIDQPLLDEPHRSKDIVGIGRPINDEGKLLQILLNVGHQLIRAGMLIFCHVLHNPVSIA